MSDSNKKNADSVSPATNQGVTRPPDTEVASQASVPRNATGVETNKNASNSAPKKITTGYKRPMKTPPRPEHRVGAYMQPGGVHNSKKMKSDAQSRIIVTGQDLTEEPDAQKHWSALSALVNKLYNFATTTRNAHGAVKDIAEKLYMARNKLLRAVKQAADESYGINLDTKDPTRSVADFSCLATPDGIADEIAADDTNKLINRCSNDDELADILEKEWPPAAYTHTPHLNISISRDAILRVLIIREDNPTDEAIWKNMSIQFRGLSGEAGRATGEVITRHIEETGQDGLPIHQSIIAVRLPKNATHAEDGRLIGQALEVARASAGNSENQIPCYMTCEGDTNGIRKILEWQARRTDLPLGVTTNKANRKKAEITERQRRRRTVETSVILKKCNRETYAAMAKRLGDKIHPSDFNVSITRTHSLKSGDFRLQVTEHSPGGAAIFAAALTKEGASASTLSTIARRKVIIKNLMNGITVKDIEEAVRAAQLTTDTFIVEEPRQGVTGRWTAVIRLTQEDARRIVEARRICIGWEAYLVEDWVSVPCCTKCQRIGHDVKSCTNEAVDKRLCHKCGEPEHAATECQSPKICYNCGKGSHAANSAGCPIYRKVLEEAKRKITTNHIHTRPKSLRFSQPGPSQPLRTQLAQPLVTVDDTGDTEEDDLLITSGSDQLQAQGPNTSSQQQPTPNPSIIDDRA